MRLIGRFQLPGSLQGEYGLHIRYEYGYALLRTFEVNPCPLTYTALVNYLNLVTYEQVVNRELKKGFGGITEATSLRTYVQDTTHLVHSTTLQYILFEKRKRKYALGAWDNETSLGEGETFGTLK